MVALTGVFFVEDTSAKYAWNGIPPSRANDLENVSGFYNEVGPWIYLPQLSACSRDVIRRATDEQQTEKTREHCRCPYASCSAQKHLYDWYTGRRVADRLNVGAQDIHHRLSQIVSNLDRRDSDTHCILPPP